MKTLKYKIIVAVLIFSILNCKKEKNVSVDDKCMVPYDSLFLFMGNGSSIAFPGLPDDFYPIGTKIFFQKTFTNPAPPYEFSNEKYLLNGVIDDPNIFSNLKIGSNILEYKNDCKALSLNGNYNCDCPDDIRQATVKFNILDTSRIIVKKITLNKQYSNTHDVIGGYPDVYLKITNVGSRSHTQSEYNRAVDGSFIWNLNDTITITDSFFNLNIAVWDDDWPNSDNTIDGFTFNQANTDNFKTGTYDLGSGLIFIEFDRL